MSQPLSMNSQASQSSSAGFDGRLALRAEVVEHLAQPVPKNCFQSRFMTVRAVSGLSRETSHRARSSRVSSRPVDLRLGQVMRQGGLDDLAALVHPVAARQDAHGALGARC